MRAAFCGILALAIAGCSTSPATRQTRVFEAGEKASVGQLTYSVVDSQILPRLGDDPSSARMPKHRFHVVQVAVSNSGNTEMSIPGMTLVDDAGVTYPELGDGSGVQSWMGVIRRVGPGATQQGNVLFDAPAAHMKLKLTEETDESDLFVDMPRSFVHERINDSAIPTPEFNPAPSREAPIAPKQ